MTEAAHPTTPQDIARAALEGITSDWDAFDMDAWAHMGNVDELLPSDSPAQCGTKLCAAAWVVHAAGWVIRKANDRCVGVVAYRAGVFRPVPLLAEDLLGLTAEQGKMIWYECEEAAFDLLTQIAETGSLLL